MRKLLLQANRTVLFILLLIGTLLPSAASGQTMGGPGRKPDATIVAATPMKPVLIKGKHPIKRRKKHRSHKAVQIINPSQDDKKLNEIKEKQMKERLKK